MEGLRWVQMTDEEKDSFLGAGGTGTLAFSTPVEDPPFALPVSYGYDADSRTFYFRLSVSEESHKTDLLDAPVTFVTHRETDAGWRSVVAVGELEEVEEMDYESSAAQSMWAVDIPEIDVFERPPDEMPFRNFRLAPERLTGRKEVTSE